MKRGNIIKRFLTVTLCAAMMITYMPSSMFTYAGDASDDVVTAQEAAAESPKEKKSEPAPEPEPAKEEVSEPAPEPEPAKEEVSEPAPEPEPQAEPEKEEAREEEKADTEEEADLPSEEAVQTAEDASDEEAVSEEDDLTADTDTLVMDSETEEEPVDEELTEEEEEEKFPAASFSGSAGGVSVKISAPEGALPEGSAVKITGVSEASVIDAAQAVMGGSIGDIKAVDISFRDKDGKEIEPKKNVTVTMTAAGLDAGNGAKVVHIADNGSAEVMASVSGNTATFRSDDFSVYLMAAESEDITVTIHITNILNNLHSVNGRAVAYESTYQIKKSAGVSSASKLATGLYSTVGGKNKSAGGLGYTYVFLNAFVDHNGGVVTADSVAGLKTIKKFGINKNGETVITYDDGTEEISNDRDVYISPVYKATANWYLNYYYVDRVSTGSGSWSNKDAVTSFSHTFRDPSVATPKAHYRFVNWYNTDNKKYYEAGDESVYGSAELKSGDTKNVYVYARWQPSVTINYNVLGQTVKTEETFDNSLNVYDFVPEDSGDIRFAGWYDGEGDDAGLISDGTSYTLPEITGIEEEVIQPAVHNVYAKFTTTHTATKVWDDEDDKDGLRKDSVEVKLLANGEDTGKTATLSAQNDWTYTFEDLNAYDINSDLIEYTVEETTDFGGDYIAEITKNSIIASIIRNILTPRITIKASDASKVYDGTALSSEDVEIVRGSLYKSDRLEAEATGSATNVADSVEGNNVINEGGYRIIRTSDGEETDVTDMYIITLEPGTLEITPAPLTVKTASATKVFDGTALTAEDAEIDGLVGGEKAGATGTGSQTAVGTSKNGYSINWDSASESNYEVVSEELGDLTVTPVPAGSTDTDKGNTPSGGSSKTTKKTSSKSTTTRTATTSAVTTGTAAPAAPIAPAEPAAVVPDEATPQAAPAADIPDAATPLAEGAWALINLIAAIVTALGALIALFRRKEEEDEDEQNMYEEEEDDNRGRKMFAAKIAGALAGIAAPVVFILTEDMSLPMAMTDRWTILMIIMLAAQIVAAALNKKASEFDDEEDDLEPAGLTAE